MVAYLSDAHSLHLVVGIILTRENGKKDIVKSKKLFSPAFILLPYIDTHKYFVHTYIRKIQVNISVV